MPLALDDKLFNETYVVYCKSLHVYYTVDVDHAAMAESQFPHSPHHQVEVYVFVNGRAHAGVVVMEFFARYLHTQILSQTIQLLHFNYC